MKQIVVGNSIATIAFLDQIGNHHNILWLKDGEKPNGIWGGFKYRERILDFAMINFEFDLYNWNAGKNSQDYNQLKMNDCSRFISIIKEYILRHVTIKQLPEIKIYTDSGFIEDFLISNNLADLQKYLFNDKEEVENKSIRKSVNLHPQFKNDSEFEDEFLRIPLNRYVETTYGSEISKKIYSRWGNRLVGKKYLSIPTLRHRSIWLPLYYPETIINYTKENTSLSPTQFFYPEKGTISEFVNDLYDKLNNLRHIEKADLSLQEENIKRIILEGDQNIIWGSSLFKFLEIMNIDTSEFNLGERGLIDIEYYECDISECVNFKYVLLNLTGEDNTWYRITIMPNVEFEKVRRVISIERMTSEVDFEYKELLNKIGFKNIEKVETKRKLPAFQLLTSDQNQIIRDKYSEIVQKFPKIKFIGNASFTFASTFNDHIIQAILAKNNFMGMENGEKRI